ncbi:MAG TPA: 16S rRNA (adenine(1518)-N(6)/adenine(1519)-N(6))-dimethyltransferase [Betaproteobacteria bacterium]|nr:16S rRNA (adenine(1518)-N(6)/adenine(1519)-N(6))-dimethyltransferase [Betaproteobacteria bacterium]
MNHIPRKRFGQHFLTDPGIIDAIVRAIAPAADDAMVEIGPGLGALTRPLLQTLDHLHAVELDRDIITRLQQRFPPERLTIHSGDALTFDFTSLGGRIRVVGNLPYNISTPLLFHLSGAAGQLIDLHFMLQQEVVARMVAEPATAAYGRLSVMLQYHFTMEWLFSVPPQAFRPPPKVESAIVRLIPWRPLPYPAADEALFGRVVAAAFAQRRKTLRNTLKRFLGAEDFTALGIDAGRRAETLGVAEFAAIANYLHTNTTA